MIRVIIIDDEPSSVNVISMILEMAAKDLVEVIATSNSPAEGRRLIESLKPDLVFLDVEMPAISGIELVKSIADPELRVVFITAHDAYAVEAFRLDALNYLLKPVEADDVMRCIEKVRKDIEKGQNTVASQLERLEKLLYQNTKTPDNKVAIAMAGKIVFISVEDIIYCEANGPYTFVYLIKGEKLTASKPLADFETQLTQQKFFRIHHSHLINLNKVKEYQRHDGGYVVMENAIHLEVSQRKRKDFLDAIQEMII